MMQNRQFEAQLVLNIVGPAGAGKTTAIESLFGSIPSAAIFRVHSSLYDFARVHGLEPEGDRTAYFAAYNAMHSGHVQNYAANQGEPIMTIPRQILELAKSNTIVVVDELRSVRAAIILGEMLGPVFRTLAMTCEQGEMKRRIRDDDNRQPSNPLYDPLSGPMSGEEAEGIGRNLSSYPQVMAMHNVPPGVLNTTALSRENVVERIRDMIQPLIPEVSLVPRALED